MLRPSLRMIGTIAGVIAFLLIAAACGGGEQATPTPSTATQTPRLQPTATVAPTSTPVRPAPTAVAPTPTPAPPTPTAAPAATVGAKLTLVVPAFSTEGVRPAVGPSTNFPIYAGGLYDWMTWPNQDGSLGPGVLQNWQMAADGKSWTLTVRSGMKFHNGDSLIAEDVKFSMDEVVAAANQPLRATNAVAWSQSIASVDVTSPTTLRVNLKRPWPLMPYDMSPRQGAEGAVVPKAYYERVGLKGFDDKPISTGPWKLVRHDISVRFGYETAGLGHPYREAPKFKELEILAVPEESTRVAMLKTGVASIVELASFDTAKEFQRSPDRQLLKIDNYAFSVVVFFGVDDPRIQGLPAAKREVREGLRVAVNAKEIVDTIFAGQAEVASQFLVAPGTLGYNASIKPKEYSPTRARALLAQAGYPQGFSIRMISTQAGGTGWMPRMAEVVAGYWSEIGIQPRITPMEWTAAATLYRLRPQAAEIMGVASTYYGAVTPTNITYLQVFYHSKGVTLNLSRPQLDALLDEAATTLDNSRREKIIQEVVTVVDSEHSNIPIAIVPAIFGADKSIASWKPIAGGYIGIVLETVTPRR